MNRPRTGRISWLGFRWEVRCRDLTGRPCHHSTRYARRNGKRGQCRRETHAWAQTGGNAPFSSPGESRWRAELRIHSSQAWSISRTALSFACWTYYAAPLTRNGRTGAPPSRQGIADDPACDPGTAHLPSLQRSIINWQPSPHRHSPQTLTSISSLFKHFQIRKAETLRLPCYTCV